MLDCVKILARGVQQLSRRSLIAAAPKRAKRSLVWYILVSRRISSGWNLDKKKNKVTQKGSFQQYILEFNKN